MYKKFDNFQSVACCDYEITDRAVLRHVMFILDVGCDNAELLLLPCFDKRFHLRFQRVVDLHAGTMLTVKIPTVAAANKNIFQLFSTHQPD